MDISRDLVRCNRSNAVLLVGGLFVLVAKSRRRTVRTIPEDSCRLEMWNCY